MNCPLCGARVLYRGLSAIECAGAPQEEKVVSTSEYPGYKTIPAKEACPNYKATKVDAFDVGSFEWARFMWLQGWHLQECVDGAWVGSWQGESRLYMKNFGNPWRVNPSKPECGRPRRAMW